MNTLKDDSEEEKKNGWKLIILAILCVLVLGYYIMKGKHKYYRMKEIFIYILILLVLNSILEFFLD